MSYNVLADSLVYQERSRYPRSTAHELSWSFRSVGLLEEIRRWTPSVLCLQEIDEHHYESFWKPKLVAEGYSAGVYQERTVSKSLLHAHMCAATQHHRLRYTHLP